MLCLGVSRLLFSVNYCKAFDTNGMNSHDENLVLLWYILKKSILNILKKNPTFRHRTKHWKVEPKTNKQKLYYLVLKLLLRWWTINYAMNVYYCWEQNEKSAWKHRIFRINSLRNRSANLLASLLWFVRSAAIVGHMACLEGSWAWLSPIKTNIFFFSLYN